MLPNVILKMSVWENDICRSAGVDICEQMGIAVDYFGMIANGASPDEARKTLYIVFDGTQ